MTQGFGLQQALDDKRLNQILTQAREKQLNTPKKWYDPRLSRAQRVKAIIEDYQNRQAKK